ncbi:MAG: hypothetical protein ABSB35_00710 [Bryobacteraceae bacterium]|jgi:hypothetical protein
MKTIMITRTPDGKYQRAATDQEKAGFAPALMSSEQDIASWLKALGLPKNGIDRSLSELRESGQAVIPMD